MFLFIFLLLFNIKDVSIWLQELFWYTIILNVSFLFHVCYLNWLYIYCWNRRYQYLCFLINRFYFFFSLTFIIYLINHIRILIYKIEKINKYFEVIAKFLLIFTRILNSILFFFILSFINYSLFIQGRLKINFTFRNIIYYLFIFLLTLIISILILGIPRLYLIWIYLFLFGAYKTFIEYWEKENIENKKIFTFFEIIKFLFKDKEIYQKLDSILNSNQKIKGVWQRIIAAKTYYKPYILYKDMFSFSYDSGIYSYLFLWREKEYYFNNVFEFKDWYTQIYEYWDENFCTWELDFGYVEDALDELELVNGRVYNLTEEDIQKVKKTFCLNDEVEFRKVLSYYDKKNAHKSVQG